MEALFEALPINIKLSAMKIFSFLLATLATLNIAFAQDYSSAPNLERKEQVMYLKGSDSPYTGEYNMNHENGKPFIRGKYINGLKEGKWMVYDSVALLRSEESFVNNLWDGIRKTYHASGKISTIENFKAGLRSGMQEGYYENGQAIFKVNHENGKKEGKWIYYYTNGKPWEKGQYKNGKNEGKWTTYDEAGKVTMVRKYKDGVQVSGPVIDLNKEASY